MPRREHDQLGERDVPDDVRHGIHTERAVENFPLLGRPVHRNLARAYGAVKLAALRTNRSLGYLQDDAATGALERACHELFDGTLAPAIVVDALQGGAGTSTNMNVNEVLANRALDLLGRPRGSYDVVSPVGPRQSPPEHQRHVSRRRCASRPSGGFATSSAPCSPSRRRSRIANAPSRTSSRSAARSVRTRC